MQQVVRNIKLEPLSVLQSKVQLPTKALINLIDYLE